MNHTGIYRALSILDSNLVTGRLLLSLVKISNLETKGCGGERVGWGQGKEMAQTTNICTYE
jgi:hypothetical protein